MGQALLSSASLTVATQVSIVGVVVRDRRLPASLIKEEPCAVTSCRMCCSGYPLC